MTLFAISVAIWLHLPYNEENDRRGSVHGTGAQRV